ncbi:MAG: minor capsid protein [Romboutsia timonensis]
MNSEEIKKAIENNSNYWEKRALENKLNIVENEEDYINRITAIYDKASKDIEDKLAKVYARYAKENGLTLDEAYQKLPKAMETQYKKDVLDYISKAKEDSTKWRQYLLNQSLMHKHSILDQLRTEYRQVIYDIDMEETGGKFLEKIFTNSNYYAQYSNNEETFAHVDKDKIQALLQENWSGGGNFSESIWKDREKLIKALDDIVIRGLAVGESFDKMADKLAKRMDTSKSNAKRLIMTESARMDNEGLLDYYKRTGVEKLLFVATLDMRTSDICRSMDGEIIEIENAKIGLNVPPLHPYCRSVISPYYEDNIPETRIYRDKETGKSVKGRYRTYKEYLEEELDDKKQAEAIVSTKNDLATLIQAIGTVPVAPKTEVKYTNPNYQATLPTKDRHTLLQMKGEVINSINSKLSNEEELTKEMKKQVEAIDSALDKLQYYNGEVVTDIRPGNNNPLDGYSIGDIWKPKKYLFSTKKNKYYNNAEYRFVITSKTGRDLTKIDNYKTMKEVIFKRGTSFKIIDIKVKKKVVYYYLEELIEE